MSLHLSKSRFCSAVQCPKMLWLKHYKPEAFDDSVMNQNVLDTGSMVGDLAMGLFGPFVEVPFGDLKDMLSETDRLIEAGTPIIAEASFSVDGNFCSVDILKNLGNKRVKIYEVKSSTSISDIYLYDAGYQYYVLDRCGFSVEKVSLVTIDNTYVRHGDLELDKLFAVTDVTAEVLAKQIEISEYIDMLREYMEQADEPQHVLVVGDAQIAPHLALFDIAGVDGNEDLRIAAELLQHTDLTVRLKAGQHTGGVIIVEQLAAELQIELAAELIDPLTDLLRLQGQIFFVVESFFHALSLPR